MPGFMVDISAQVTCSHAGVATPMMPDPRVLLGGSPIVVQSTTYTIPSCPLPPQTRCVTGSWLAGATRVFAGGVPVVLQGSLSSCVPNGNPLLVLMTQMRVSAM